MIKCEIYHVISPEISRQIIPSRKVITDLPAIYTRNAVSSQFINIHEYQLESEGVGVNCVCPTASFICPCD